MWHNRQGDDLKGLGFDLVEEFFSLTFFGHFIFVLFCFAFFFYHIFFTYWLVSIYSYCCPITALRGVAINAFLLPMCVTCLNSVCIIFLSVW